MSRNSVAVLTLLLLSNVVGAQKKAIETLSTPPNIVLVLADDWSYPHASIYGDSVVSTPNFDRIAKQGVLFNNAYCAAPSCSPSRAALLTGRYPHALEEGANLWGTLPVAYPNFTTLLEEAGYQVVFQEKGWAPGSYRPGGYSRNPAGKEVENFEHFIENIQEGQPFFLWYGTRDPHRPYTAGLGRESGMSLADVALPAFWPQDSVVKSDVLDYYYEVQRIDYDLGRLLFRLERNGHLANTLIVVTSDNGMPFPRAKANCYDLGTRVPLAIFWADSRRQEATEDAFVNLVDLAPTFLAVAGVPIPTSMHGRSLLPLLSKGKDSVKRENVFLERERHAYARSGNLSYPIRAIRDSQFLLIHNLIPERWPAGDPVTSNLLNGFGDIDDSPTKRLMIERATEGVIRSFYDLAVGKRPEYELYDVQNDTFQINNLANNPDYEHELAHYQSILHNWRKRTGDHTLIKSKSYYDGYEYYGGSNELLVPVIRNNNE